MFFNVVTPELMKVVAYLVTAHTTENEINIDDCYRKYAPMVLRRCRFIVKDEEAALDIMQEVFIKLLRNHETLNDRALSSLLYTIATNLSLNYLKSRDRKRARTQSVDKENTLEDLVSLDLSSSSFEARETLEQIFSLGDELTRTIAWLYYVDGFTLEETALHTGFSVSGVRKRLRKLHSTARNFREAHL